MTEGGPITIDPNWLCACCGAPAIPEQFYDGAWCERCWDQVCHVASHLRGERDQAWAEVRDLRATMLAEQLARTTVRQELAAVRAELDRRTFERDRLDELIDERDQARKAAAHLWYGGEHGVSQEEVCEWYPWVVDLLDEHASEWTEARLESRRELREQLELSRQAWLEQAERIDELKDWLQGAQEALLIAAQENAALIAERDRLGELLTDVLRNLAAAQADNLATRDAAIRQHQLIRRMLLPSFANAAERKWPWLLPDKQPVEPVAAEDEQEQP